MSEEKQALSLEELRRVVVTALEDMKAVDLLELDVREKTSITDLMLIVSGNSNRHVRSIANNLIEEARKAGMRALGVEGQDGGEWVLVDLGDIVVHIMQPATRELYRLERIWGVQGDSDDAYDSARG